MNPHNKNKISHPDFCHFIWHSTGEMMR